jgi:hypothetical protein
MPDILVRGLSHAAVAHYEEEARALGISRAEVLRRHLESDVPARAAASTMTPLDWERFSQGFADLADPDVMGAAWR